MTDTTSADAGRRWLDATWPFIRQHLPPPACRVLDVGCGPLGGYVPALVAAGHRAEGVDPEAPAGPHYHRVELESYAMRQPADVIIASTSLHHMPDLPAVVDLIAQRLHPGGVLVVMEWARERVDEATARWCFDRLPTAGSGWLHRRRDEWLASGRSWGACLDRWACSEGLHTGQEVLDALAIRFDTRLVAYGPYLFADLAGVTAADEQAAIDAGRIRATGVRYVGSPAARTR